MHIATFFSIFVVIRFIFCFCLVITTIYCPVALVKNFMLVMLHCHWLRSLWRWADIFTYSPSSRKYGNFVCIHRRTGEAKPIAAKQLQRRHYKERIVAKPIQWSYCKVTLFFLISNSSLFASRENSNNLLSLW